MDPLEVRVAQLHQEVCRLTALVDALPQRLLELMLQQGEGRLYPEETHKDVLPESWAPLPEGSPELGLEWQVRRLMARLACANHRIAQLEEQLSLQLLHQRPRWRSPDSVHRSI